MKSSDFQTRGAIVLFRPDDGTDSAPAVVVEAPAPEGEAEAVAGEETAQVEVAADAAVQIAQIEADKEITLAVIEGENRQALEEAWTDEERNNLRAENARLQGELDECRNTIQTLEMTILSLTPPPSTEEPPPPNPPPSSEDADGPAKTPEPPQEPEAAEPPSEPPKKRKRIWT